MRKKIVLLSFLVLAVAATLAVFVFLNNIIEKFRPQLEGIASEMAGSPVTFGNVKASLFPSTAISISDITVQSTAQSGESIKVKAVDLRLSVWALMSRKLEVTKAVITGLDVLLIKKGEKLHIPGVKARAADEGTRTDAERKVKDAEAAGLQLDLSSLELTDSVVVLSDLNSGKQYSLTDLNLNTSLRGDGKVATFPKLELTGKVLDKIALKVRAENIKFDSGSGLLEVPKVEAALLDAVFQIAGTLNSKEKAGRFTIGSSGIELTALQSAMPDPELTQKIQSFSPEGRVIPALELFLTKEGYKAQGTIEGKGISAKIGDKSVSSLNGTIDVDVTPQEIKAASKNLSLAFNSAPITAAFAASLQGKSFSLRELKAQAFGGNADINANGELSEPPRFQAQVSLANINIEKAMMALTKASSSNLVGTLTSFKATLNGEAGPELMNSISGSGSVLVSNGALKNVNVAGDVLKGVKDLPFISGALATRVPEGYRNAINSVDTEIKSLTATLAIGGGGANTKDLRLLNPLFDLEGNGRIGFNNSINLNCDIRFESELSKTLVGSIKELSAILDREKRLAFPVSISGVAPELSFNPDISKLLERGTKKVIQDKAGELLEGVLEKRGLNSGGLKDLLDF